MGIKAEYDKTKAEMQEYVAENVPPFGSSSHVVIAKMIDFLIAKIAQQQIEIEKLKGGA